MNQSNSFTYSFDPVDLDFAKQTVLNLVEKNEKLRNQLKDANKIIKNLLHAYPTNQELKDYFEKYYSKNIVDDILSNSKTQNSIDEQIRETLRLAGVQLNETENAGIEENPHRTDDTIVGQVKAAAWNPEINEDTTSTDTTDWSVKEAVQKIASEKGISNHDAMIEYSDRAGIDFGEVYDLCMFGDEHLSLEQAKKELEAEEKSFRNAQYADDFLYSNGGWDSYQRRIDYLKRLIKRLENKEPVNESYESEVRTLLGNGKIDRELAEQPWAKNPPEINNEEWSLVSYKNFDIIVYHYNEDDDNEDEKFEVEIYPKGQADDTKPPIDYMNSHSWMKCLEKIAEVANKDKPSNTEEPEDDGDEYDYTKVDPEATKELSEWMNKWVIKKSINEGLFGVNLNKEYEILKKYFPADIVEKIIEKTKTMDNKQKKLIKDTIHQYVNEGHIYWLGLFLEDNCGKLFTPEQRHELPTNDNNGLGYNDWETDSDPDGYTDYSATKSTHINYKDEDPDDYIPEEVHQMTSTIFNENHNPQIDRAIKYVYDGMKAKYGRSYPKEEDEDDYEKELCAKAAKQFNVTYDEVIDKLASDYVDSMPYVIQDKQGNYSEI